MGEVVPPISQDSTKGHRVSLLQDTELLYPELWSAVYVAGSPYEQRQFAEMFVRAQCRKADTPEEADFVVFTGGEDVNPALYGEERHHSTRINTARDESDMILYDKCLTQGIPMMGVCRGAQFLHVMNGGKLYQDVDHHFGDHNIYDIRAKRMISKVSSVHHQMVIKNDDMEVIAESGQARNRWKNPTDKVEGPKMDIEAFFYRDTMCFGVQGHPEYRGYHQFAKWTLDTFLEVVCLSPDIAPLNGVYRIKPDILQQRNLKWKEQLNTSVEVN